MSCRAAAGRPASTLTGCVGAATSCIRGNWVVGRAQGRRSAGRRLREHGGESLGLARKVCSLASASQPGARRWRRRRRNNHEKVMSAALCGGRTGTRCGPPLASSWLAGRERASVLLPNKPTSHSRFRRLPHPGSPGGWSGKQRVHSGAGAGAEFAHLGGVDRTRRNLIR